MKFKICPSCKNRFYKKKNYSKKYWKKQKYCSPLCSNTWFKKGHIPTGNGNRGKIGKESSSYKGGRNTSVAGYIRILIPGTGNYQLEHRLIMEEHLGRKLKTREIVHHKNSIRNDNRIENLEVLDKRDHDRFETKKRWRNKTKPFRANLR